jgi:hypothetical protein
VRACRVGGDTCSGRAPFVAMMKAADLRDRHDGAVAERRDGTRDRRVFVFVQRQVRAGLFAVGLTHSLSRGASPSVPCRLQCLVGPATPGFLLF